MFNNFKNWPKDLSSKKLRIYCFISQCYDWFAYDHFYVFWLEPISINETKEHLMMYYVGDDSANGTEFTEYEKRKCRILERSYVRRY